MGNELFKIDWFELNEEGDDEKAEKFKLFVALNGVDSFKNEEGDEIRDLTVDVNDVADGWVNTDEIDENGDNGNGVDDFFDVSVNLYFGDEFERIFDVNGDIKEDTSDDVDCNWKTSLRVDKKG